MHVTSEAAKKAIDGALKKAESTDTRMCIAVVDSGGALKAFYRMDDAWVGSIDIAIKKPVQQCILVCPVVKSANFLNQASLCMASNIQMMA